MPSDATASRFVNMLVAILAAAMVCPVQANAAANPAALAARLPLLASAQNKDKPKSEPEPELDEEELMKQFEAMKKLAEEQGLVPKENDKEEQEKPTPDEEEDEEKDKDKKKQKDDRKKRHGRRKDDTAPDDKPPSPQPMKDAGDSRRSAKDAEDEREQTADVGTAKVDIDVPKENWELPYTERTYSFSIVDGEYAELVQQFARMTGLPVFGKAPSGEKISFYTKEPLDYDTALGRIRMILYKKQYFLAEMEDYLELVRFTEIPRELVPKEIYWSIESFLNADLRDHDIAMLIYEHPGDVPIDLDSLRDFMPDYVRTARLGDTDRIQVYALVRDIKKHLQLAGIFSGMPTDARRHVIIPVEHISASEALEALREMVPGINTSAQAPSKTRRTSSRQPEAVGGVGPDLASQVDIYADDDRQRLLVRGVESKIEEVREMLKFLDLPIEEEEYAPVIIKLEHVPAEEVIGSLNQILTGEPQADLKIKRSTKKTSKTSLPSSVSTEGLTMIPEPRSNSIVLFGEEEKIDRVRELLPIFDVPKQDAGPKRIVLEHAKPEAVQSMLSSFMGARGRQPKGVTHLAFAAFADPGGRAIFISGTMEDMALAERLIAEMDTAEGKDRTMHVTTLKFVSPATAVEILTMITSGKSTGQSRKGRPATPVPGGEGTQFYADNSSNRLFVLATADEWEQDIKPLIDMVDQDVAGREPHLIDVTFTNPQALVLTLSSVYPEAVTKGKGPGAPGLSFAASGSYIVITGATETQLADIEQLVRRLDVDTTLAPGNERRIFRPKHISAGELVEAIQTLLLTTAAPITAKGRHATPMGGTGGNVRIAEVAGGIVVSAPTEKMKDIAALIESLDTENAMPTEVRSYHLPGADANEVAKNLEKMINPGGGRVPGPKGGTPQQTKATFVAVPASSSLIVSAPTIMFTRIEELIDMFKSSTGTTSLVVKIVELDKGDPEAILQIIQPILEAKEAELRATGVLPPIAPKSPRSAGGNMSLCADARTNRIVMAAPPPIIELAEILIEQMQEGIEGTGEQVTRIIKLQKAEAQDMAAAIRTMLTGVPKTAPKAGKRPPTTPTQSGPSRIVNIVAAPGSNSLVLTGYAKDVDRVEEWIHSIDEAANSARPTLTRYQCVNTKADDTAQAVMAIIDPGGIPAQPKQLEDTFDWMPTNVIYRGKEITTAPDYYTNSILISTSPEKLAEVNELLAMLEEQAAPVEGEGRPGEGKPYMTYPLENADAFDAMLTLESYLEVLWPSDQVPEVDYLPFTNILVVKGNPEDFEEIRKIIRENIDKPSPDATIPTIAIRRAEGKVLPSTLAELVRQRLPDIDIEIEEVRPPGEERRWQDFIEEVQPFVAPVSMQNSLRVLATQVLGQSEPDEASQSSEKDAEKNEDLMRNLIDTDQEPASGHQVAVPDEQPREPKKVRIRYDDRTGVIRLEGPSRAIADIDYVLEGLIEEFKKLPDRADIRVFRLKHVDVNMATTILEKMFNAPSRRAAPAQRGQQSAQQQRQLQQQLQQMQQQMKQAQQGGIPGGEDAAGKKGKGGQLQPGQQNAAPTPLPQSDQIRVYPDARMRTLIIRASTEDFPVIVELLAKIDKPGKSQMEFKIIQLTDLNAKQVEAQLKELLGIGGGRSGQSARQPTRPGQRSPTGAAAAQSQMMEIAIGDESMALHPSQNLVISSNPATNSLLIVGPGEAITLVEDLIADLQKAIPIKTVVRDYPLIHANVNEVIPKLEPLFKASGTRAGEGYDPSGFNEVTVTGDPRTNILYVRAVETDFPKIEPLIERFDVPVDTARQLESFALVNANAASLAKALNEAYRTGGGAKGGGGLNEVRIIAEAETNTILVWAPEHLRKEIADKISLLDGLAAESSRPRTIALTQGDAESIAAKLQEAFAGSAGKRSKSASKVHIVGDTSSRQIFVTAPDQVFEQINDLARQMDVAGAAFEAHVYRLKYAQATEVLGQLKEMVQQLMQQLGRAKGGVSLDIFASAADPLSNAIIVMGGPRTFALVESILMQLDVETQTAASYPRIITLKVASASQLAQTLTKLFTDPAKERSKGSKGGAMVPMILAEEATNALVVRAQDADYERIATLVSSLDKEGVTNLATMKIIPVAEGINVTELAATIEEIIKKGEAAKAKQIPGYKQALVAVGADTRTNSLILAGSPAQFPEVEKLVRTLEEMKPAGPSKVRIISVENIDPSEVKRIIDGMITDQKSSERSSSRPRRRR